MLAEEKLKAFTELAGRSSREELAWMNGYLSGLLKDTASDAGTAAAPAVQKSPPKITIAYGTETGNSKKLATGFAARAKKAGIRTRLVGLDQYAPAELEQEDYFFTIISTHGEGEPPAAAKNFYDHIHRNGFRIPKVKYGVLALGDTAYPLFCKTGEDVDSQLQQLGASRIAPLQKCDTDYEEQAESWFTAVLQQLSTTAAPATATVPAALQADKKPAGKKIYTGTIASLINLTGRGSTKKTYHIEISSNAEYLPGDSIAVVPSNDPLLVQQLLALTGIDAAKPISWRNETVTAEDLLLNRASIIYLPEKTAALYASLSGASIPPQRADLLHLLKTWPLKDAGKAETLLQQLTAIAPRIYNIASSPAAHEGSVHITVLQDVFTVNGQEQHGLCTRFFESRKTGDPITFFVQPNKRFRLPAGDKDIIMIGPGTGIAPFRSFVAERDATAATGRSWLFFAETDFTTDFYYQTEWQTWLATGVLTRASVAFAASSGMQVQHKIIAEAAALFEWIENGAYVYLCGEKDPMSKQAETALLQVFETAGNMTAEAAATYFESLKTAGRYMKDVY